jgi:hypothetical protein
LIGIVVPALLFIVGVWLFNDSATRIIVDSSAAMGLSPPAGDDPSGVYTSLQLKLGISEPSHFRAIEHWTGVTLILAPPLWYAGWIVQRFRRRDRRVSTASQPE